MANQTLSFKTFLNLLDKVEFPLLFANFPHSLIVQPMIIQDSLKEGFKFEVSCQLFL